MNKSIIKKGFVIAASAVMLSTSALLMNNFVPYQNTTILAEAAYDVTTEFASADNYAAECILNGFIAPSTGEQSDYSLYSQVLNREYGYEILAQELVKDKGLIAASAFWTLTNEIMDSGPIGLDSLNETQLYEVFLMDYLTYESKSAEYKSDLDTKTVKYSQKLYKAAVDMIVDNGNDLMEDTEVWKYLTIEDAQKIAAEADFCDNVIKKYTKVMGTITKIGTTAEDYLETLSKAAALNQANQERIDFLLKVKAQASDNKALCNAINNIITQMESSFAVIAVSELGKTAGEFAVKYAWGKLSSSIPGMDAVELASGGMDLIFNTDDMATNNIKLLMMYAFKQYAERALMTSCNNYDFKTETSATAFNGDFTAYLTYQEYVSEWTKTFASDVLLEGWFNKIRNIFSDKNKSTYDYWKNTLSYDASFCTRTQELLQKYKNLYYQIAGQTADVFDSAVIISDADEKSASEDISKLIVPEYYTHSFSSNLKLEKDMVINGNAIMSASVDLNGYTLTVNGDLIQTGGILEINKGTLNVNGNYEISSDGYLHIDNGIVNTAKNFVTKSNHKSAAYVSWQTDNDNRFTGGILSIGGNFYQYNNGTQTENFKQEGTKVKFVGSSVHEIHSQSANTTISNIILTDGASISFNGKLNGFSNLNSCTFSSSDQTVAKITGNTVQSVSAGYATLTIDDKVSIDLTVEDVVIGDANFDGKISVIDVVIMQKYLLGRYRFSKAQWEQSDMNNDGIVNIFDFCLLKRKLINS
ncbi:MAG: dockerin type I repeat-containing protein [Oscillospiraceae bacterium]|nr:dockerin type I repeat-containing protein [Oscillospiraceae bacterium]